MDTKESARHHCGNPSNSFRPSYACAQMNITITLYDDRHHRNQVIALWKKVFTYETAHNRPDLVIDKKLAVNDDLFFVALADDTVVGTVMAGYDGHRGWIYSVAVSPSHRRQGIGAQLVSHAEHALIAKGSVKINLQIMQGNESVTAFYASLGYSVEKRISMGKPIPQNCQPPQSNEKISRQSH
jgi:ribosomal protein S18 acetylase RimI-like enzyme